MQGSTSRIVMVNYRSSNGNKEMLKLLDNRIPVCTRGNEQSPSVRNGVINTPSLQVSSSISLIVTNAINFPNPAHNNQTFISMTLNLRDKGSTTTATMNNLLSQT